MEKIESYIDRAKRMLSEASLDKKAYDEMENYILKNGSRLSHEPKIDELRELMSDLAHKHGLRDITCLVLKKVDTK